MDHPYGAEADNAAKKQKINRTDVLIKSSLHLPLGTCFFT